MHKLEVTLKQHTPLIHFQHGQDGATLRATEVKQKLDRFIIESLKSINQSLYIEYKDLIDLIPDRENKCVSPYKLSIKQDEDAMDKFVIASFIPKFKIDNYRRQGYKILDKTLYFADNKSVKEGKIEDVKLGLMMKENKHLTMVFSFFDPRWEGFLKKVIHVFFTSTNFGSRQNKGFGCFYPNDSSQSTFEDYLKDTCKIAFKSNSQKDLYNVYCEIDSLYKKLKSGGRGRDGELRKYFNRKRPMIEWEKPAIQEKIMELSLQRLRIDSKTDNRQFVRALLGLPELYEYPRNNDMKVSVKYDNEKEEDREIERYPSPILFKVFENTVYLVIDLNMISCQSAMLNKKFMFEFKSRNSTYEQPITLLTPEQFDLADFIDTAMRSQFNWKKL